MRITGPGRNLGNFWLPVFRNPFSVQDFSRYLGKEENLKIAAALKGCDVMGLYELAKRGEVRLENILMLGLNCGDSISPETARKMIVEKFSVDLDSVKKERISKGKFIIETPEGEFSASMDELEGENLGRRSNCRRCKLKIPRPADLACGEWGIMSMEATFVRSAARGAQSCLSRQKLQEWLKPFSLPRKVWRSGGKSSS